MASNKRPPLEMEDLTSSLKQSAGKGVDAFFPTPVETAKKPYTTEPTNSPTPSVKHLEQQQKEPTPRRHDVMTSSRQDDNLRRWRDIIEDTETHNSALRITNDESYEIEDMINELRRKYKIKTSMNEIARLGLLYIIDDFKKDKRNALIIKVKKS